MATDAGFSVCEHEGREIENDKGCRREKKCKQQWHLVASSSSSAAAAASDGPVGKKSHKIPLLIYVIRRTMAFLGEGEYICF